MIITYEYKGSMHEVEFDSVLQSSDMLQSMATAHPIEKGSVVSDHINHAPDHLSVEAAVTNTPIAAPRTQNRGASGASRAMELQTARGTASVHALQFDGEFDRVKDVYGELRLIRDERLLCDIKMTQRPGGFTDYESMALVGVTTPRSAASGGAASFVLDFQKIKIVETQRVTLAVAGTVKNTGKGATKEPPKDSELESLAHRGKDAAVKWWRGQ